MININNHEIKWIYYNGNVIKKAFSCGNYVYEMEEPTPPHSNDYLTFVALEDGQFKFGGNNINYSLDDGDTWVELSDDTYTPTIAAGNKILWKGELYQAVDISIGAFSSTNNFNIEGNIMSLIYGDDFEDKTSLEGKNYVFSGLFIGCTHLLNAEKLVLPATTLSTSCYSHMFNGCYSLQTAPELPATTLVSFCYSSMFNGCRSLQTAPELPATTLASYCYLTMFYGCTSLQTAPELPATTLVSSCYTDMFQGCISLNYIKCLAVNPSSNYQREWLNSVALSGTFVKKAGVTWPSGSSGIPEDWTVEEV